MFDGVSNTCSRRADQSPYPNQASANPTGIAIFG